MAWALHKFNQILPLGKKLLYSRGVGLGTKIILYCGKRKSISIFGEEKLTK